MCQIQITNRIGNPCRPQYLNGFSWLLKVSMVDDWRIETPAKSRLFERSFSLGKQNTGKSALKFFYHPP